MTVSPVLTQFVKPLCGVFKRTPGADEAAYFKLLKEKLAMFAPEDLSAAADEIATQAETQTWPPLSVCLKTCQSAAARRVAAERSQGVAADTGEAGKMPEDAAMRVIVADGEAMGRAACEDNWIVALIEFVQANKRMPAGGEVDEVRAIARSVTAGINENMAHGSGSFIGRTAQWLHDKRLRTAERMREMLKHPAAAE